MGLKKSLGLGEKDWNPEAEKNWLNFWNTILQEDMRQNPNRYKKGKNKIKLNKKNYGKQ